MFHSEGPGSTGTYVHTTSQVCREYLHSRLDRARAKTPPDLVFARYKVQEQTTGSNRIPVTLNRQIQTKCMVYYINVSKEPAKKKVVLTRSE
jgi:hypothetical protein